MSNDVFDSEIEPKRDYEKISYGKFAYKRVQRLRRKGKRRGIEVPYLDYELTKPEKPRIAFWIVAILSAVLFVSIIVCIGFLYNELIKHFSDLSGVGAFIKSMFKPSSLKISLGLSALPGLIMVVVYILILILFLLPIVAAIYFYKFVRNAFYMAKCSKEEFAKGNIVSSLIFGLISVIAVATILFIVLLSLISSASAKLYAGLIFGFLVIALGSLLTLMIIEKNNCGKWMENLEEYKKQNYLEHDRALRRVKSHLRMEKNFWSNLGK